MVFFWFVSITLNENRLGSANNLAHKKLRVYNLCNTLMAASKIVIKFHCSQYWWRIIFSFLSFFYSFGWCCWIFSFQYLGQSIPIIAIFSNSFPPHISNDGSYDQTYLEYINLYICLDGWQFDIIFARAYKCDSCHWKMLRIGDGKCMAWRDRKDKKNAKTKQKQQLKCWQQYFIGNRMVRFSFIACSTILLVNDYRLSVHSIRI